MFQTLCRPYSTWAHHTKLTNDQTEDNWKTDMAKPPQSLKEKERKQNERAQQSQQKWKKKYICSTPTNETPQEE